MPIVVARHLREVISKPELTQQQKDLVWEAIVRNWAKQNPEQLRAMLGEENDTVGK